MNPIRAQQLLGLELVRRIGVRVDEHDRHALDSLASERLDRLPDAVRIKRQVDAAVGEDPLAHAEPQGAVDQRRRRPEEVIPDPVAALVQSLHPRLL